MKDKKMEYKQKAVQQLKECGEEIVKAADKMIGGYDFQCDEVRIAITICPDKAPVIDVNQELIPDPNLWMMKTE